MKKQKKPVILSIDQDVIVCIKPYGMPVQNDKSRDLSLLNYLKNEIARKEKISPEVYVVHRLDRPVGGIMVFARTKAAASALSKQMQTGTFEKYYQAVLTGHLPDVQGVVTDYLVRNGKCNTSRITSAKTKGAKLARLEYEVLDEIETDQGVVTYALIHLLTGRHHQIRVQCANLNAGIWGDTKYNKKFQKTKRRYVQIGLYATRIEFEHPSTGERLVFKMEPEGEAFDILDMEEC